MTENEMSRSLFRKTERRHGVGDGEPVVGKVYALRLLPKSPTHCPFLHTLISPRRRKARVAALDAWLGSWWHRCCGPSRLQDPATWSAWNYGESCVLGKGCNWPGVLGGNGIHWYAVTHTYTLHDSVLRSLSLVSTMLWVNAMGHTGSGRLDACGGRLVKTDGDRN